jgi:hypothetical protein
MVDAGEIDAPGFYDNREAWTARALDRARQAAGWIRSRKRRPPSCAWTSWSRRSRTSARSRARTGKRSSSSGARSRRMSEEARHRARPSKPGSSDRKGDLTRAMRRRRQPERQAIQRGGGQGAKAYAKRRSRVSPLAARGGAAMTAQAERPIDLHAHEAGPDDQRTRARRGGGKVQFQEDGQAISPAPSSRSNRWPRTRSSRTRRQRRGGRARAAARQRLLRIYDGAQPATGDTAITTQNLLAQLRFNATSAPAAAAGVLTFSAFTADSDADATGTAAGRAAARPTARAGDGRVGRHRRGDGTENLKLNSVAIQQHAQVSVTSATHTVAKATAGS